MIESFASKKLERFFGGDKRTVGPQMQRRATNILSALYAADTLEELNIPGYDLHALKGDRKDFWSMKVLAIGGSSFVFMMATFIF